MLWEVDIFAAVGQPDMIGRDTQADAVDLGFSQDLKIDFARGYLLEGTLTRAEVQQLADRLLADQVVERTEIFQVADLPVDPEIVYVLPKPGVTDTVAENARRAIRDFGLETEAARTFKKYRIQGLDKSEVDRLTRKLLANDAIEQAFYGQLGFDRLQFGAPYQFQLITVPIRAMKDDELETLSLKGQLYLSLTEMQTIQKHFVSLDRDPTDIELETIAQTWSEHCSHKTLAGRIDYEGPECENFGSHHLFENMLKETIFAATVAVRKNHGPADRCVSVFSDNAGVVKFDEEYNVCFKVETHNHPSALEPYGGANTGIGGVIRDPMGTGMGAKPICNTDVFCFAPPTMDLNELPAGVLHPRRIIKGVVAGVRDYGNRMGIPTVNGAVYFDRRYMGNPLVYCGNVGLIPVDKSFKQAQPGDYIVAMGGRTGRDGIHGATFSSAELTSESETLSGGAVQIGNAITEKTTLDILLAARDRGLYNAVTDCGAGGFSSAVGEMGEKIGADVELAAIPVKYEGLSYTEMWISEAQERMVFSVPKEKWPELKALADSEGVETVILGEFKPTGRLHLKYNGVTVADLGMSFLHNGRPPVVRKAVYKAAPLEPLTLAAPGTLPSQTRVSRGVSFADDLVAILSSLDVASKHWVVRQYDHEVQGGSVVKPLVGVKNDGPGDAAVLRPRLTSRRGLVISCGMNPHYGDLDTGLMAASAIDEAMRNAVAVGADPATCAILDNFCWGNPDKPEVLGSLVHASCVCYEMAVGYGVPFVSGKDSLNNEFRPGPGQDPIAIPPSLLISAMAQVDDVATCVTMDLKESGNVLYQVGQTKAELGGSHFSLVRNLTGGQVPTVEVDLARRTLYAVHEVIQKRLVRSVHDLSEGGLAAAAAEMAFAGGLGVQLWLETLNVLVPTEAREKLLAIPGVRDDVVYDLLRLFAESNSRFLIEVAPDSTAEFEAVFAEANVPLAAVGKVTAETRFLATGANQATLIDMPVDELKTSWVTPFDLGGDYKS
ncbi:MAG: AIR synthase-related protein [Planctomycetia bacterium]|nr:AIR synthase-related protein [Planctomycetia bacterium]